MVISLPPESDMDVSLQDMSAKYRIIITLFELHLII